MHESNFHVIGFSYGSSTTTSSRPSRLEYQHSSSTFGPGILATDVGTSSWRASPTVGNASVDDTDAATVVTFFFSTDGKTFVPTFNCYLRNTCQCQMTRLLIHLSSSNLLRRPNVTSSMRFSMWEDPVSAIAVALATTQCRDELCYM
jgi:hypothetical protein